jgi:predicted MFS family arabinose efflux permease
LTAPGQQWPDAGLGELNAMFAHSRDIAVATAGFCAFLNLYSPQALLPVLAQEFGVGPAEISNVMTASALAIAVTAPFTGALADVLGRKRVITAAMLALTVPMAGAALAWDVQSLIAWRFLQGLLLPAVFAVTVAYIGDEWPAAEVAGAAGVYIAGSSLGGFCGRFIPGVLGDLVGWREAFLALAGLSLAGAVTVALLLPREKGFVRSPRLAASAAQMLRHLQEPQLVATYAIGFGVLFNFIAVFTYVSFHLAAPPYRFSSTMLGAVFVTYLAGTVIAPMTGWAVARLGRRRFMLAVIAAWGFGAALTLAPPLPAIIAGLVLCAACGMLCQTISTGYVTAIAKEGRSSAVGLYVTSFYIGGSMGALLPGLAWNAGGWPACIAMVGAVLAAMAVIAQLAYRRAAV